MCFTDSQYSVIQSEEEINDDRIKQITMKADLWPCNYAWEICDIVWNADKLQCWLNSQHHRHWIVSVDTWPSTPAHCHNML